MNVMLTLEVNADSDYLAVMVDGKEVWRSSKLASPYEVRKSLAETVEMIEAKDGTPLGIEVTYTDEGRNRSIIEV